jgi:copper(I)-binding protein
MGASAAARCLTFFALSMFLSSDSQTGFPMLNFRLRLLAAPVLTGIAVAGFLSIPPVHAAPSSGFILVADGGVMVQQAWARASAGPAHTGAAYVTLMGGSQPDSLIAASTPVAATADVHETIDDHGIMKMRSVKAVPIPAGKMVTFAPGGYHIMLMGLKHGLMAGQTFPLTLTFAHAAPITVEVQVRGVGHDAPMGGKDHMKM